MSAVAVMPGRSVFGGSATAILISNSVFCSLVPGPRSWRCCRSRRPGLQGCASSASVWISAGLAGMDRDDVVLVDVDLRFHLGQVGDHHDDVGLELRAERDLADFLVQLAHRAGHGRVDRGLGQVVARLLERGARLLDLLDRRLEARFLDLPRGLLGVEVRLRLEAFASSSFERANSFCAGRGSGSRAWRLPARSARSPRRSHGGEVALAVQLDQERALLDPLPSTTPAS
jgi:hypothetical protein